MNNTLTIIGAGLAGSEAAWQAAERGVAVTLYEMRPATPTPAHKTGYCAELVCSNSLGTNQEGSAPGLLKAELRQFNSLVIGAADANRVPAGAALAVDRELFSKSITEKISNHPLITLKHEEVTEIPSDGPVIIATGPLTSPALSASISKVIGEQYLYFYDAISPIIDANSIDYSKVYWASRYNKGTADYLNCYMNKEQYYGFVRELLLADKVPFKTFEKPKYFEGCMPIEELASRGEQTLAFGPLKPVGLPHPDTGKVGYAVVQLRAENAERTAFNMVGFQTKLTYPEQKRVFSMIPGLENAEMFRFGAIHRNTFVNAPNLLNQNLALKTHPGIFFAGQVVGVEGYVESVTTGLLAGLSAVKMIRNETFSGPPSNTAMGSLLSYVISKRGAEYQPMNINFGLFSVQEMKIKNKKERNEKIVSNALKSIVAWMEDQKIAISPAA